MRTLLLSIAGLLALLSQSCTVGTDYHAPAYSIKKSWPDSGDATTQHAAVTATDDKSLDLWWKGFDDPKINSLVDRAVKQNLDLAQARERVMQARAASAVAASGQYPSANLDGTYDYYHRAGPLAPAIPGDYQWYQTGFDASWELDVFGGVRRNVESATADYQASVESSRDVRLSLIAEVVRDYVDLRTVQRRLELARTNLAYQEKTLSITRERFSAGVVGDLDVYRAESLVGGTRATLPVLADRCTTDIRLLGVLLALDPDALAAELTKQGPIPSATAHVHAGIPGELLRRRPDIRAAERRLAAANARIGLATANLYPRFSLLGGIGQLDIQSDHFFDWSRHYAAIGPEVSWDIFDAGKTNAQIQSAQAATRAALANYQQTILIALAEVENAMTALDSEHTRHGDLANVVIADQKAVARATEFYVQGITDFTTVLDAERSLAASQDALAVSSQVIDVATISLCKALGGGWENK
jgi:NodT family efflux transporter outer membrane factor (OMF) lipoprotein